MYKRWLFLAPVIVLCGSAFAINKCVGPDGKVAFQDAPCTGKGEVMDVRPASGSGKAVSPPSAGPASAASSAKPASEARRLDGIVAESQRERRRSDLQAREIPEAAMAIDANKRQCAEKTRLLEAQKDQYVQNLAGTVHRASVTSELAAHQVGCNTKDRDLREALGVLREECKAIGCK